MEAEEARVVQQSRRNPDESVDLYAQAFGSFVAAPSGDPRSRREDQQQLDDDALKKAAEQAEQLARLSSQYAESQVYPALL